MRARSWLLVKGLKQDGRHWRDVPERLAQRVPGRVVTLDLPGAGTARNRGVAPTVAAFVDDLARRWAAVAQAQDGPWGMVGLSLGGMLALHWMAERPSDISTAIVGNSSLAQWCPPHWRIRPTAWATLLRAATRREVDDSEFHALALSSSCDDATREKSLREHVQWQREAPFTRAALLRQALVGMRARPPSTPDLSVLVLQGGADRLVDPRCSERLASKLGAPLIRCAHAGHDLSLDDPAWLISQIVKWGEGDDVSG